MASTTTNLNLKLLGTSLADKEKYFEEWRQDINGEGSDSNMNIIDRAYKELADGIDDLRYVPIAINTLTANPATAEKGSTVTSVTFTFALNKVPTTLKFGTESITPEQSGTKTISSVSITSNTTWTMEAKDSGSATISPTTVTKNVALSFQNKVYWGAAAAPSTVNSAFVLGLSDSALSSTKARTFTISNAGGNYIWYAVPKAMGSVTFKVGGFDGGFEPAQTISFTNASGHTENYYVYRSTNVLTGQITVVAS